LENHSASPAGLLDKNLTREGLLGRSWIRYSGAIALVGAALAVRSLLLPANGGFAFITFYPTVIAVGLVFGAGPGVLASVLSALFAAFLFLSPFRSQAGQAASFGFFFVTCGLTTFVAHRLRKSVVRLRASELKFRTLYETSMFARMAAVYRCVSMVRCLPPTTGRSTCGPSSTTSASGAVWSARC